MKLAKTVMFVFLFAMMAFWVGLDVGFKLSGIRCSECHAVAK